MKLPAEIADPGAWTMKKNVAFFLLGMALTVTTIMLVPKVGAQSPTQTRIYIPWIGGTDAGYSSILLVENTSVDNYGTTPAGGTCTVDAEPFAGGAILSGSLGNIPAGQSMVFSEATIAAATGLSLANSGQRAYLFVTCNFKYAHAQALLVNPGGVVTFIPGYIIPPNRSLSTGPEQLLQ